MRIAVKKLRENAVIPRYATAGAAAMDLYVSQAPNTVFPGETVYVHTGLAMAIPKGYVGLIFARSGLASTHGLAPANKVGVIDSDYRGEIVVALHNHGDSSKNIAVGDRIAQMMIVACEHVGLDEVDELSGTERGTGGFGSTGK